MDVLMSEEEQSIRDAARDFLQSECPPELARRTENDPTGYARELWSAMAAQGWIGLSLPEEHGGQGLPLTYTGLLMQEVGRHVAPVPLHSTVTAGLVLARHGSDELRSGFLPALCAGDQVATFALQGPAGAIPDPAGGTGLETVVAVRDGDDYVLEGLASYVDNAAVSDWALVACTLRDDGALDQPGSAASAAVLLVDLRSDGVVLTSLVTTAKDPQSKVRFEGVRVPVSQALGAEGSGWAVVTDLLDHATVLLCAQMVGATRKDLEMAVDYSKQRHAFGRQIGAFQAIQHLCADMLIWTDGAELLTMEAVWRLGAGLPASVEVSQAKAFANQWLVAVCRSSQQIHGGIGFMMEFDLQLWYRRVVAWSLRLGTVSEHRARVARELRVGAHPLRLDSRIAG